MSHPKSPEPKDDDDEVDDVSEEHEGVDIGGSPVFCVDNTPKKTFGWMVNAVKTGEKQSNHTPELFIYYYVNIKAFPHKCDELSNIYFIS